jgi:phospholipid/cholesterol/gamma-HCH transport system substrate-binding protein
MESRAHALIAGVFTFLLLAGLIAAAVWLSGRTVAVKPYVVVATSPTSGLNPEAQVRLRGVVVGKVKSIGFDPDDPLRVLIGIEVEETTPVTLGTFATLGYQGITGLSYISLDDSGNDRALLPTSAEKIAQIELRPSFVDQLTGSGQELIVTAGEAAKRLNALLDETNRKRFADTLANLDVLSRRIIVVAERLEPVIAGLPRVEAQAVATLTRVDGAFAELQKLSSEARAQLQEVAGVTGALREGVATWSALGVRLETETVPAMNAAVDGFSRSTRRFGHLATTLREQPQGLLFGPPVPEPGPGEPGFAAPRSQAP